jgi:sugar/nucleoside kinase (ribokinase family)
MTHFTYVEPIDYLVIGHLTRDLTTAGPRMGGTAAYSALTARALGLRVGVVTSIGPEDPTPSLEGVQIVSIPSEYSTTFENIMTPKGRIQYLYHVATSLDISMIPGAWRKTPIIHLGPVAQEVEPNLVRYFPDSFLGVTPQGWLRKWNNEGRVQPCEWPEARFVLEHASASIISIEDVQGDENRIEEMASSSRILVVTEAPGGARVYWNGDLRRFRPPPVKEVDATGAGDIFATVFFSRLQATRDPWEAARYANQLAAISVTRPGLEGVPTHEEVETNLIEILEQ